MNGILSIAARWSIPSYLTDDLTNEQVVDELEKAVRKCLDSLYFNVRLDPIDLDVDGIYERSLES